MASASFGKIVPNMDIESYEEADDGIETLAIQLQIKISKISASLDFMKCDLRQIKREIVSISTAKIEELDRQNVCDQVIKADIIDKAPITEVIEKRVEIKPKISGNEELDGQALFNNLNATLKRLNLSFGVMQKNVRDIQGDVISLSHYIPDQMTNNMICDLQLPIKNRRELMATDVAIRNSFQFFRNLIDKLASVCGEDSRENCSIIIKQLFSRSFAIDMAKNENRFINFITSRVFEAVVATMWIQRRDISVELIPKWIKEILEGAIDWN